MAISENKRKMLAGELYHAFAPELVQERRRCSHACHRFNNAGEVTRRKLVELWQDIVGDQKTLPSQLIDQENDDALFDEEPWIEPPVHIDYGTNVRMAPKVYINFNCTILDTCVVSIGTRTLIGPNVSFFSATHPLDPALRDGTEGPEGGKEIHVEEDCWIGGNVIVLAGVRIGRGATVGAGSVVTKDVAPFTCVAGNPARFLRKINTEMNHQQNVHKTKDISNEVVGPEQPMAELAQKLEQKTL